MSHRMSGSTPLERTTRHGLDCVCVCGSLGFQISVQDTKKPSDEWVEDPAERGDEAWVP